MRAHTLVLLAALAAPCSSIAQTAGAAERWREDNFPPPNGGHLVFTITGDGNPACASYDGSNCLWGKTKAEIDFTKVRPLVCGAAHRRLYGVTGFEDPGHWCNLAQRERTAQKPPPAPPPAPAPVPAGPRLSDWSGWARAAGVQYRYRVRWDPVAAGTGKTIEAIFEVRNAGGQRWSGAARALDCARASVWGSTDVDLAPGRSREVHVRGPNCGSARNPDIRPDLVRAGKFD